MTFDMINTPPMSSTLGVMPSESKQWLVVSIPSQYSATNWPIRVCHYYLNKMKTYKICLFFSTQL